MDNITITEAKKIAQKEREVQLKKAYKLIAAGVVVGDPQRLDIRGTLVCGKGVEVDINVVFEGDVLLEDGVIIGSNCILRNCKIGKDTQVNPFSLVYVNSTEMEEPFKSSVDGKNETSKNISSESATNDSIINGSEIKVINSESFIKLN